MWLLVKATVALNSCSTLSKSSGKNHNDFFVSDTIQCPDIKNTPIQVSPIKVHLEKPLLTVPSFVPSSSHLLLYQMEADSGGNYIVQLNLNTGKVTTKAIHYQNFAFAISQKSFCSYFRKEYYMHKWNDEVIDTIHLNLPKTKGTILNPNSTRYFVFVESPNVNFVDLQNGTTKNFSSPYNFQNSTVGDYTTTGRIAVLSSLSEIGTAQISITDPINGTIETTEFPSPGYISFVRFNPSNVGEIFFSVNDKGIYSLNLHTKECKLLYSACISKAINLFDVSPNGKLIAAELVTSKILPNNHVVSTVNILLLNLTNLTSQIVHQPIQ